MNTQQDALLQWIYGAARDAETSLDNTPESARPVWYRVHQKSSGLEAEGKSFPIGFTRAGNDASASDSH